jgi:hypothetical protein
MYGFFETRYFMHCTFSPSTINQRLAAIRKLATEAQRCGYVDSETAQAIVSVPTSCLVMQPQ